MIKNFSLKCWNVLQIVGVLLSWPKRKLHVLKQRLNLATKPNHTPGKSHNPNLTPKKWNKNTNKPKPAHQAGLVMIWNLEHWIAWVGKITLWALHNFLSMLSSWYYLQHRYQIGTIFSAEKATELLNLTPWLGKSEVSAKPTTAISRLWTKCFSFSEETVHTEEKEAGFSSQSGDWKWRHIILFEGRVGGENLT